jgi:hypothetical protein
MALFLVDTLFSGNFKKPAVTAARWLWLREARQVGLQEFFRHTDKK